MTDRAYAFKNSNEILMKSSSGGAFIGLCKAFIKISGENTPWSIYGVKFDDDFRVVHSRATTLDECFAFCGSKYAQSDLNGSYKKVADDLINGYNVLFTGTPCQIAGVTEYVAKLENSKGRLYTVDIICHGTPRKEFWEDYVKYLEEKNKSKLVKFSFRDKRIGWKGYPVLAEFENGKCYENKFDVSLYVALFRKDLLMRKACFNCKYPANFKSDITIGDFWGVELSMPEVNTKGGVSLVVVHSDNGMELLNELNTKGTFLKEAPDQKYLDYNPNLKINTAKPDLYDSFWNDYEKHGIEYVINNYAKNNLVSRMKFNTICFLRNSGILALAKKVLKKA